MQELAPSWSLARVVTAIQALRCVALIAARAAEAVRGHCGIENRLHWVLDVVFKDDLSRLRKGHGTKNMAVVRHFAINRIRSAKDKRSMKLRRKIAGGDPNYLVTLLNSAPH